MTGRMTVTDWRAAHSWLKGYSDALLGKPEPPFTYDPAAYSRGRESAQGK